MEKFERQSQPQFFADIRCTPDHSSGWDYVCTYTDPHLGREKMGIVVQGHLFGGSGSTPVDGTLPDGPHLKAPSDGTYARRADAVCAQRAVAVRALPKARNRTDVLAVGERINFLEEREQSVLAGIKPPDDERDGVSSFIRSIDAAQRGIEEFRDALERRNAPDLVRAQAHLAAARRASNAAARRLGLSCRH